MNLSAAERADAYLHGLMTDREVATFERDLEQDADLRAVLETARRRMALLESALPPAEADERLINHTMYRIEANEKRRKRLRKRLWYGLLTPLTVAILAIGFLHVHYDNLSATPANLEVFGQNQLIPGSQAALRVRLTDGNTHAPIANVPVEVSLGDPGTANYRTLANFTTDALGNGQPSFRLPDWADGSYTLRVAAQTADAPELLTQRITLKRSSKLMLTTDKPVYQPGQTIHMRSLTLRKPDLKPLANANATFRVTDPKGNVIFQKTETTSKYGIAAADCPLADEIIEGNYVIFARVGDTESSVAVQVFHYVLPKIQLTVTTDKTWYAPGDEVKGKIEARYFHGEPVADAEWKVAILISPDFRPEVEAKGQTDPAGRTAFSLRLPMNLPAAYQPNGWNLTTILRDRAGQERDKATPLSISDQPLKFDLVPESGSLVDGYSNRVYIFASTPDGMPAKVKGQWRGLNSETLHDFETNELGVGVIEIMLLVETASLHLSARDSAGRKAECDAQLSMVRSTNDFLLRTDQAVYTGGDSMKISAWGSGPEPLFLDILKDGQTIRSGTINLGDRPGASGTGEWIIDLPPELFGVLEIRAYRMEAYREPITKTRSIYVRPASTVVISAKPNRPEYRPGDKAIIAFTLTDGFDKPAPGALSLSAIDEAVFALARSRPGLEASILHLDHELINPFAAGPIGSPESPVANDDSRLLESARSARSVQTQLTAIPLTLGAGTFETKKQETEVRKSDRLTAVRIAWVVVVVIAILTLYAVSWFYLKWRFYAAMHAAAFLSLACVCSMFLLVNTANTEFLAKRSMPGMPSGAEPVLVSDTVRGGGGNMSTAHIREQFPETMLWQPQIITDDAGHATLEIDLADSITTWRLSGSAITADGRLGSLQSAIRVFQPFFVDWNLPVALTRNDEIDLPAVVSNFLPTPQTVEVTLAHGDGFELLGGDLQTVTLKAKEVRSVSFRIRAKKAGRIDLGLTAKAGELTDALKRSIEVIPDGRRVESVTNGTLTAPATVALDVPPDAIDGSVRATVRIYPSAFSQVVEGLDGIFKLPTGCFEQTSSSLYPNVMALTYLRQTGKSAPAIEAKARGYIHAGYQRLLKFEVPGGGFDWYGNPPANIMLTAYGLMEFRDMAAVHDVDPKLIDRTRNWLLSRRESDGSWFTSSHLGRSLNPDEDRLRATAYVAWAVFDGSAMEADSTRKSLLNHSPDSISDPYILALVANALTAIDPKGESAAPYLARLESLKHVSADGRQTWWELPPDSMTAFFGSGPSGNVETTALTALAFLKAGVHPAAVRGSLVWLAERQDANGLWGSTQATIQALKALLAGGKPVGDGRRTIEIAMDGRPVQTLEIPADQAEVMKQIDLSALLKPGSHSLALRDLQGSGIAFQVAFHYHVPGDKPAAGKAFTVEWKCDRNTVAVNEIVTATATLTNRTERSATMVMAELPIPAGFILDGTPTAVPPTAIDRHEATPRQCLLYLRELVPNRPVVIAYRLKAIVSAKATVPPVRVYEYYNPANEGRGLQTRVTITGPNPKTELEQR